MVYNITVIFEVNKNPKPSWIDLLKLEPEELNPKKKARAEEELTIIIIRRFTGLVFLIPITLHTYR